jgi:hypothetical protein
MTTCFPTHTCKAGQSNSTTHSLHNYQHEPKDLSCLAIFVLFRSMSVNTGAAPNPWQTRSAEHSPTRLVVQILVLFDHISSTATLPRYVLCDSRSTSLS